MRDTLLFSRTEEGGKNGQKLSNEVKSKKKKERKMRYNVGKKKQKRRNDRISKESRSNYVELK